jgi:hypothetical protein
LGYEDHFQAHIVNYADDLVICCQARAEEVLAAMRRIMQRLKLTVNEEKTQVASVPRQEFDFLGYTFGHCYAVPSGRCYLGNRPSKRSVQRLKQALSEATSRRTLPRAFEDVVQDFNRMLRGWGGYFCLGSVGKAYRGIDRHTINRLRRWFWFKHKRTRYGPAAEILYERFRLYSLARSCQRSPWMRA